mmetsp:Transcript_25061/g.72264  ORF Transcript_25061/g.72264 Transcript_25061/m.72264 type:complete len:382 (+) Transcript_25061:1118-2263(+)
MTGKLACSMSLMSWTCGRFTGRPCLSVACSSICTVSSITCMMLQGAMFSLSFLLRMLEMSMMLDTKSNNRVEQLVIILSFRCRTGSRSESASVSLRPQMPWIGERSSCDTTAMKRIFLSSRDLCSVMSCPMLTTPTMAPVESNRAVALKSSTTTPVWFPEASRQWKRSSKFAVSLPFSASRSTVSVLFCALLSKSQSMIMVPRTSDRSTPEIRLIFWFHSVTRKSWSTPKIGALAESISRASSSAARSAFSFAARRSVMSCPTPIMPMICPFGPRRGVADMRIWIFRSKCLVKSGNSKFAVSCPRRANSSTFVTLSLYCALMKQLTRFFPSASSLVYSVMVVTILFHSVTSPWVLMPKIGALAVSMICVRSSATLFDSAMS